MINIILQGSWSKFTNEVALKYANLDLVSNIIISCWENDNPEILSNKKISVTLSKDVDNPGITNRNRQITSSLAGLKNSQSEFSVKLRADQEMDLNSFCLMCDFFLENFNKEEFNKIGVGGIFRAFPFHPRDQIFIGKTKDLISLFNIELDKISVNPVNPSDSWPQLGFYSQFIRSEIYIASRYCARFDDRIKPMIENEREFLVDFAPKYNQSLLVSSEIMPKVFLPLPRLNIKWPKYGLTHYPYDWNEMYYGEYYHKT